MSAEAEVAATVLCPGCLHDGVLERTLVRAEKAEGLLEALDDALPDEAEVSVSPELVAALVALWDQWWNKAVTMEHHLSDHAMLSHAGVYALDEAAERVEKLMQAGGGEVSRG